MHWKVQQPACRCKAAMPVLKGLTQRNKELKATLQVVGQPAELVSPCLNQTKVTKVSSFQDRRTVRAEYLVIFIIWFQDRVVISLIEKEKKMKKTFCSMQTCSQLTITQTVSLRAEHHVFSVFYLHILKCEHMDK